MITEQIVLNEERNVHLTAYLHASSGGEKLPAILVVPGGGYRVFADVEAEPPALAYFEAGYQAFVLQYTIGEGCHWPLPLDDYEAAMEQILAHADAWQIDTDAIVVAGFSAGGHLTACAITTSQYKPAAAILVYPVILPDAVDRCMPGGPYPGQQVTEDTCPCFLVAANDDDIVDIRNTLAMENYLADHGVPFESHIYSTSGHAFSIGVRSPMGHPLTPRLKNWVTESIGWLNEILERD